MLPGDPTHTPRNHRVYPLPNHPRVRVVLQWRYKGVTSQGSNRCPVTLGVGVDRLSRISRVSKVSRVSRVSSVIRISRVSRVDSHTPGSIAVW
jgi:hypothetical protein